MFSKKALALFLVSLVALIDMMGIGLVYPMFASMLFRSDCLMLPCDTCDATRGTCLGILLATMPIVQFFAAPVLGMLSDQKGRKKVLAPALCLGVLGYLLAVYAVSIESFVILLLSRVAIGISAGTFAVVAAALADISTAEDKTKNFGLFNMAGGLGFTIGPFLGGLLSSMRFFMIEGYALPFALAALMTFLNLLLILFFFQDSYEPKLGGKVSLSLGFYNIKKALRVKSMQALFFTIFLACVGWSFYWEFTPVTWISAYGFSTVDIGNFYAYGAIVYSISCGLLIRPIVNRFSNQHVLCYALMGCGLAIGMLLFQTDQVWLWVYIPLQQFAIALFWPTAATVVSNSAGDDMQGEMMGVLQSVDSLAFAVSPLIAGPLLGVSTSMPIIVGGLCMFAAAAVLGSFLSRIPDVQNCEPSAS